MNRWKKITQHTQQTQLTGQFKYTRLKVKEETNYIQRDINNQIIYGQVKFQSNCLVVDLYTHAVSFPEVVPTLAH